MLAILTRMTLTQVSTWFANARRRLKKESKVNWPEGHSSDDEEGQDEEEEEKERTDDPLNRKGEHQKSSFVLSLYSGQLGLAENKVIPSS